MTSFSEQYRAFNAWKDGPRTPEDYQWHLENEHLRTLVLRLLGENSPEFLFDGLTEWADDFGRD